MKHIALGLILALGMATPAMAKYEAIDVSNGGSIKGKVIVTGNVPKDETITISEDQKVCGTTQLAEKYLISAKGEVKNVFVIVEGVKKGKAAPKMDVSIQNHGCMFVPHAAIAYKKSKFVVKNNDPVFHNTKMRLKNGRTIYNLAFPKQGQEIKKPVRKVGMHNLICDAHKWMRGYVYASDNPYVDLTGADGSFEIKDLPPGKYTLKIWHEGLGEMKQTVEVAGGKATEIAVEYKK